MSSNCGDLTCQLEDLGVGATAAAAAIYGRRSSGVSATAAIRGRRSSRGGSRSGLESPACSSVESQCGFETFGFCGTSHRVRAKDLAFPDLEVRLDVPGLAAAAVIPHLAAHLQVYGHE